MSVWVVLVAAGSGRRFGGAKQFAPLGGGRVIDLSLATAVAAAEGVVVVLAADAVNAEQARLSAAGAAAVVPGGATRSESVRAGLAAVPPEAEVVLVHDAARPLAGVGLFTRVIDAVRGGARAVVPAVPVADTIRAVDGGVVDRDGLRAVQTPQGFEAATLRAAHESGGDATDDAGLVEAMGERVQLVDGHRRNLKITEADDLAVAAALLAHSEDVPRS